jgi:hypothetical protein
MMEDLPYDELFAKKCGIPPIVWEGKEQGLNIFLLQCETPIDFSYCFGPLIS